MLKIISGLGIVPGMICVIIGFIFIGYFWLPRRSGESRSADSNVGLLAQVLMVLTFLAPGLAIVLGHFK
ncbi:hypothetical protein ABFU52_00665 [Xanthomonas campestris pv. campestris]|uniref:hypothetical protein n=1 Tax=Xanthomonas campestris TaxID=339 RepID=UPI00388F7FCE